ncbi:ABC transporter ATP-binding protein [Actinoalloteichus caeruleus]|uniref:ABC transporter ATP-binding protein n=1 Tax=Actinoalloteichus cyanogriseus TaxID=2893586 RepID=UPI003BB93B87
MLELRSVSKTYGSGAGATPAIGEVSLTVRPGEFLTVVGPSGCGKTTLLKCMTGLLRPTSGEVLLDGRPVTGPPADMALVFQEYGRSLMPWSTVRKNIMLPLRARRVPRAERERRADEALAEVGLAGFGDHYPWQLSGGMQQRVAIARALAYRPKILVMDEPFASVDAQTRADLEDLVLRIREAHDITIVFVTHDIDESVYLSDRIAVLGPSPTSVRELVEVDLPSPRDQVATKRLAEFGELRTHVYRRIRRDEAGSPPGVASTAAPAAGSAGEDAERVGSAS